METWLKSHQSQFRGQTLKFKKHVAQVPEIISSSGLAKSEIIDSAVRYGLYSKLAARLSVSNLATFYSSVPMPGFVTLSVPGSQYKLDSHHSKIMSKLQSLQVHPDTLRYSKFEQANSVYCMFQVDFDFSHIKAGYRQPSSLLYVGSTGVNVAKQHLNRMSVFRRLKKTAFVDAELSSRYWASHDNLF